MILNSTLSKQIPNTQFFIFLVLLSISFCTQSGFSQVTGTTDELESLSLQKCIEIGIKRSFDIQVLEQRRISANAGLKSAYGQYTPSVAYQAGFSSASQFLFQGQKIPQPNSYNMSLGANLNLFDGFYRENQIKYEESYISSLEFNINYVYQKIRNDITNAYLLVKKNEQIVRTRKENMELGKKDLDRLDAQLKAGIITVDNIYSQEAENGTRELAVVTSENDLNISKANLLNVMGLSPDKQIGFVANDIKEDLTDNEVNSFEATVNNEIEIINTAFENRNDFKNSQAQIKSTKALVDQSYSNYYPSLTANGGWHWQNTEFSQFGDRGYTSINLNLNVPIFDQFRNNNNVQLQQVQQTQAEMDKLKLEQNIKTAVRTALLNLKSAKKQIEISNRSLKSAERNYVNQQERFKLGAATFVEVNTANSQFVTAKINKINSVYNFIQAQNEIKFAMGKLN